MYFNLDSFIEYCGTPVSESISKYSYIDRKWVTVYEADDANANAGTNNNANNTDNLEGGNNNANNNNDASNDDKQKRCEEKIKNIEEGTKTWWQAIKEFFANLFKSDAERRRDRRVAFVNKAVGEVKNGLNELYEMGKNENGEFDEDGIDRIGYKLRNYFWSIRNALSGMINDWHLNPDGTPKNKGANTNNNNNNTGTNNNNNNTNQNNNNNQNSNTSNNQEKKEGNSGDILKDSNTAVNAVKNA